MEAECDFVADVRKKEKWHRDYEPKQSEIFRVELQKFVIDNEDGFEELTPFDGKEIEPKISQKLAKLGFGNKGWIQSFDFYNNEK